MSTMLILRGISGAGKSTFTSYVKTLHPNLVHCSADFIHEDSEGNYNFDFNKLSEGHGLCFRTAVHAAMDDASMIVVDNTHTSLWETSPYVLMGQAYNYNVVLVRLECPVEVAAARNVHGVPEKAVENMARRFQNPLPFWPKEYKFTNPTEEEVHSFFNSL